jgi:hypothetical protein
MRAPAKLITVAPLTHFRRPSLRADPWEKLTAILRDGIIGGAAGMVAGREPLVGPFDAPRAEVFGPAR